MLELIGVWHPFGTGVRRLRRVAVAEHVVNRQSRAFVSFVEQVTVNTQRHRGIAVTEAPRDGDHVRTCRNERRRMTVPKGLGFGTRLAPAASTIGLLASKNVLDSLHRASSPLSRSARNA